MEIVECVFSINHTELSFSGKASQAILGQSPIKSHLLLTTISQNTIKAESWKINYIHIKYGQQLSTF